MQTSDLGAEAVAQILVWNNGVRGHQPGNIKRFGRCGKGDRSAGKLSRNAAALEALLSDPSLASPDPARAKSIPADQQAFLAAYQARQKEMIEFLERNRLITLPPWLGPFTSRQLPEAFKPTSPGGFMNPPGLYDKDPEGFYFIPTYNPKSGNFYIRAAIEDPRPILGHEGIPGHFLQISIANHLADEIRRQHADNVFVGAPQYFGIRDVEVTTQLMALRSLKADYIVRLLSHYAVKTIIWWNELNDPSAPWRDDLPALFEALSAADAARRRDKLPLDLSLPGLAYYGQNNLPNDLLTRQTGTLVGGTGVAPVFNGDRYEAGVKNGSLYMMGGNFSSANVYYNQNFTDAGIGSSGITSSGGMSIVFNLIFGFAGQISVAQAGFFGLGAYTAALLQTKMSWPFAQARRWVPSTARARSTGTRCSQEKLASARTRSPSSAFNRRIF